MPIPPRPHMHNIITIAGTGVKAKIKKMRQMTQIVKFDVYKCKYLCYHFMANLGMVL